MTGIILHHYDASPFSEKVRLMLGLKQLEWSSVLTPNMMPKPDLVPLTGGYRRAPVMQIGADIYCDSQVILAEIERRHPEPRADHGPAWPVNLWADRLFFQLSVAIIFGRLGDRVDPAFAADREKLSGRPFDTRAMAAMAGPARAQWRAQAGWIDRALVDAPYLAGDRPGIADLAAYMDVWFVGNVFPDVAAELLAGFDRVMVWRDAIRTIGHGTRTEMTGGEALAVAKRAQPVEPFLHDPAQLPDLAVGDAVIVAADDYGRDPIRGTLVSATPERVTIARDGGDLGTLNLHFPSAGFVVRAG